VTEFAALKAKQLNVPAPSVRKPSAAEKKYDNIRPAVHPDVKGKKFNITSESGINEFIAANPAHRGVAVARDRTASGLILKYLNGSRSVTEIRNCVSAETGQNYDIEDIAAYISLLKEIGWII
jgi:hypothetical protein